jgi:tetratricopeptide (TPR) repeat protein
MCSRKPSPSAAEVNPAPTFGWLFSFPLKHPLVPGIVFVALFLAACCGCAHTHVVAIDTGTLAGTQPAAVMLSQPGTENVIIHTGFSPPNRTAQRQLDKGTKHEKAGQLSDAVACYTRAIEADPNNNRVRACRLQAYRSLKQYDLALQDCDEMIRLEPQATSLYLDRAWLLLQLNRPDEALAAFEHLKTMAPESSLPELGMADAYTQKGNYDEALRHYDAFILACPSWPGARFCRGKCNLEKRAFDDAIADFDAELKLRSAGFQFPALYWRAKAFDQAGRTTEALAAYQEFHQCLANARVSGSKTAQNLKNFGLNTLIGAALLQPGFGLASVLDNPAQGFTKAYDTLDADAQARIKELKQINR